MRFAFHLSALTALTAASPGIAAPRHQDFDRATSRVRPLADATRTVPGAAPAAAFIAVARGMKPVIVVDGVADVRTGAKADGDTPFYIASMTKAYMGLLAAELDRKGILKLDSTIADHWPDLRIPGTDTNAVTLRNLLTHRLLFENSPLSFRTAYTDEVAAADYPALLASHSTLRKPGFSYTNLGYLMYGAILEKETGRSWKDWLASDVFQPLGLRHSSARSSDFPVVTAAHQWTAQGWHAFPMKTDALMHAAGGLVTSPNDMARWLQAHLEGTGLSAGSFRAAHAVLPHPAETNEGQSCDGYALGWSRCTAHGITYLTHGGGYTGFRSRMLIVPAFGVGFAYLTNSDSMTGGLTAKLQDAFVKALADPTFASDPAAFAADYAKIVAEQAAGRASREAKDRTDVKWGGWTWQPAPEVLAHYVGRYLHPALGEMTVLRDGGGLVAALGAYSVRLTPAVEGVFAGTSNLAEKREFLRFDPGAQSLLWNDSRFIRVN
ncbi:serine hydrolase [Allosphingosinicella flava]|uniref:Serine hydrolase n=1 Tax=Allosphingosinicella flava TaxID=2771430 RepID=A0A7T2GJD0_9SPHN|nr:serine hydrolase [Sphingosinicella flava]QPQ54919.1 serine hydrolase [Sphingosinicella flava]